MQSCSALDISPRIIYNITKSITINKTPIFMDKSPTPWEKEMKDNSRQNRYFYIENERELTTADIILNCTGETMLGKPFATKQINGRLDFYLMYMLSGVLAMEVGDSSFTLSSGEAVIIPPRTAYRYANINSPCPINYLWVHFTGAKCKELIISCGISPSTALKIGISNDIIDRFDELFGEFINRKKCFDFSTSTLVNRIILAIGEANTEESCKSPGRLYRSVEYIHTHLKEAITVESLAAMEYLSVSRYRQLFTAIMGKSPSEYVAAQRIHRACELLAQGDIPLGRVAEMCGYSDRLYFQRVFKKLVGQTPGEYKRRFRA